MAPARGSLGGCDRLLPGKAGLGSGFGWLALGFRLDFLIPRSGLDLARLRLALAFGFHLLGFWLDLV